MEAGRRRAERRLGRVGREGDPQPNVQGLLEAWLPGCDGETGKSGYGMLPQILGVDSGDLRGRKEMASNHGVIGV